MQLEVEVEFCVNCQMHAWCSQHNSEKYLGHFNDLRNTALARSSLGKTIVVKERAPPNTYEKLSGNPADTKYYDKMRDQEVYFPKLGSFEVYAEGILIFSKLRSGKWPRVKELVDILDEMFECKINQGQLYPFQLCYHKDESPQPKPNVKRRNLSLRTPQRQKEMMMKQMGSNDYGQIPQNIAPDLVMTDGNIPKGQYINVNINNYGTLDYNQSLGLHPNDISDKKQQSTAKKYQQIYSSALHEMREFARKQRRRSKKTNQQKINEIPRYILQQERKAASDDELGMNQVVYPSQNLQKKPITKIKDKRQIRQIAVSVPQKKKRSDAKKPQQEWNAVDFMDPKEFNEEQKERLYRKYKAEDDSTEVIDNFKDLITQKKKYETLLTTLKNQQKNYAQKLQTLNQKLKLSTGKDKRRSSKNSSKFIEESEKEKSVKKDDNIALPPIKTDNFSVEDKKSNAGKNIAKISDYPTPELQFYRSHERKSQKKNTNDEPVQSEIKDVKRDTYTSTKKRSLKKQGQSDHQGSKRKIVNTIQITVINQKLGEIDVKKQQKKKTQQKKIKTKEQQKQEIKKKTEPELLKRLNSESKGTETKIKEEHQQSILKDEPRQRKKTSSLDKSMTKSPSRQIKVEEKKKTQTNIERKESTQPKEQKKKTQTNIARKESTQPKEQKKKTQTNIERKKSTQPKEYKKKTQTQFVSEKEEFKSQKRMPQIKTEQKKKTEYDGQERKKTQVIKQKTQISSPLKQSRKKTSEKHIISVGAQQKGKEKIKTQLIQEPVRLKTGQKQLSQLKPQEKQKTLSNAQEIQSLEPKFQQKLKTEAKAEEKQKSEPKIQQTQKSQPKVEQKLKTEAKIEQRKKTEGKVQQRQKTQNKYQENIKTQTIIQQTKRAEPIIQQRKKTEAKTSQKQKTETIVLQRQKSEVKTQQKQKSESKVEQRQRTQILKSQKQKTETKIQNKMTQQNIKQKLKTQTNKSQKQKTEENLQQKLKREEKKNTQMSIAQQVNFQVMQNIEQSHQVSKKTVQKPITEQKLKTQAKSQQKNTIQQIPQEKIQTQAKPSEKEKTQIQQAQNKKTQTKIEQKLKTEAKLEQKQRTQPEPVKEKTQSKQQEVKMQQKKKTQIILEEKAKTEVKKSEQKIITQNNKEILKNSQPKQQEERQKTQTLRESVEPTVQKQPEIIFNDNVEYYSSFGFDQQFNPFLGCYSINGKSITKVNGDGQWHSLKTSILPQTGYYSIEFTVVKSLMNYIEFGIIPASFAPDANKICDKSIGFHFANGKLHDTNGRIDKKTTSWRVVKDPLPKQSHGSIAMLINADAQTIQWLFNGQHFADSVITNYLKEKTYTAYISMVHIDDVVEMKSPKFINQNKPASQIAQNNEQKPASVVQSKVEQVEKVQTQKSFAPKSIEQAEHSKTQKIPTETKQNQEFIPQHQTHMRSQIPEKKVTETVKSVEKEHAKSQAIHKNTEEIYQSVKQKSQKKITEPIEEPEKAISQHPASIKQVVTERQNRMSIIQEQQASKYTSNNRSQHYENPRYSNVQLSTPRIEQYQSQSQSYQSVQPISVGTIEQRPNDQVEETSPEDVKAEVEPEKKPAMFIQVPFDIRKFVEEAQLEKISEFVEVCTQTNRGAIDDGVEESQVQFQNKKIAFPAPTSQIYNARDKPFIARKRKTVQFGTNTVFNAESLANQSPNRVKNQQTPGKFSSKKPRGQLSLNKSQSRQKSPSPKKNSQNSEVKVASIYKIDPLQTVQAKQFPKLKLHVHPSTSVNQYIQNFEVVKNRITKIGGDNTWHCIKSQEVLPTSGKYSFDVAIINSKANCIEVGVMPEDFVSIENKICDKSLGYHFANGKIHDTSGQRQKKSTKWRVVTDVREQPAVGMIKIELDFEKQTINWKLNQFKFAESVITDYLKGKKLVAYVSMLHKGDQILLAPRSSNINDYINGSNKLLESQSKQTVVQKQSARKQKLKSKQSRQLKRQSSKKDVQVKKPKSILKQPQRATQSKISESRDSQLSERALQQKQFARTNPRFTTKRQEKEVEVLSKSQQRFWNGGRPERQVSFVSSPSQSKNKLAKQKQPQEKSDLESPKRISFKKQQNIFAKLFKIQQREIQKKDADSEWHSIKSTIIPNKGKYTLQFIIIESKNNFIEIGIMPASFTPVANKVCDKSIGLHFANGRLHDTDGNIEKKSTAWRVVREQIPIGTVGRISLEIDVEKQSIKWSFNGSKFADSVITNYLKQKSFVAYVSMFNKGDSVRVNLKQEDKVPTVKKQTVKSTISQKTQKTQKSPQQTKVQKPTSSIKSSQNTNQQITTSQSPLKQPQINDALLQSQQLNPFKDLYIKEKGKIIKFDGQGSWHGLKTNILPNTGKYKVDFNVLKSSINCIEVGIMPVGYTPIANKICDKSIGLHYANGRLHDTNGQISKKATAWRQTMQPTKKGVSGCITIEIDADAQQMKWLFNNVNFSESVITNYLKEKSYVAYVSMMSVGDAVNVSVSPISPPSEKPPSVVKEEVKEVQKTIEVKEPAKQQKARVPPIMLPPKIQQSAALSNSASPLKPPSAGERAILDKQFNPFIDIYKIEDQVISKIDGEGSWHGLKTNILPNTGKYKVDFNVLKSSINCIEIGIMPVGYTPIANKICDKSIGFHYANGRLHDTNGQKAKKTTAWRQAKEAYKQKEPGCITIEIDADDQQMKWFFNGIIFTESVITNYLKEKSFVAFVSLLSFGDSIKIDVSPIEALSTQSMPVPTQIQQPVQKVAETNPEPPIQQNIQPASTTSPQKPKEESIPSVSIFPPSEFTDPNHSPQKQAVQQSLNNDSKLQIDQNIESNPFLPLFSLADGKIIKIDGQKQWHSLKSTSLPTDRNYRIQFNIIQSPMNGIEIGIMPANFIPIVNKVCDKSIGFHFGNGRLHDTKGIVQKKTTAWRDVRAGIPKGTGGCISLRINLQKQVMSWNFNGVEFAQSVITNYLLQKGIVAYVSTLNKGDTITIAVEDFISFQIKQLSAEVQP